MKLATLTLSAIETALQNDQGARFRGLLKDLMSLAGDTYSTSTDPWRNHLGASLIGRECARELWYSFHWCTMKKFEGRMLRLFNRGHLEEPRMVALLQMIGCTVWQVNQDGKQFRISGHLGHFGGSLDAVVLGLPELPGIPVLAEFKTHGEKSFIKLVADGVIAAKWEHFIQMQIYMGKNTLTHSLYMAVNKNTDEIHAEIIEFDQVQYDKYLARSAMVIDSVEPPPKISTVGPSFFKCKFCDHSDVCHKGVHPEINCRTCTNSTPIAGGQWVCLGQSGIDMVITPELQRIGCEGYQVKEVLFK